MNLTIALWSSSAERPQDFIEATTRHSGLSFNTTAQGGFGDASFTIKASGWNAVRWYRSYLGFHVVIFDHLGRRVYEGRIEDTQATNEGVDLTCLGYFSHAQELTHGIVYPADFVTTPTDLVNDVIDIAWETTQLWQNDYSMVQHLAQNVAPQDFSGSKKLSDAIEIACKYGNDSITPLPMYFAVWDNRRVYFNEEPAITGDADWRAYMKDFASSEGLSMSRSRSDIWNKIQVTYDDPDIGATFTDWVENKDSQRLFGVREGTMAIGAALPGLAETLRDLAITTYAFPTQSSEISISGRIYNKAGAPDFPYMVRAGQLLRIMDYDPSVAQLVSGSTGSDASLVFISRTSYDADSNAVSLELGRKNVALDLLLARLGMGLWEHKLMITAELAKLLLTFLPRKGGVIEGLLKPKTTNAIDLGTATQRFKTIYAQKIVADNLTGDDGGGTTQNPNADTVDNFHASGTRTAGMLLALDAIGTFPKETYQQAFLTSGERALMGNLVMGGGLLVDEVDLDVHNHDGQYGNGRQINHLNLLNNDADVHPQYPQINDDEIITGDWMFTQLLDRSAGWLFEPGARTFRAVPYNMAFVADPTKAQIQVGANQEILVNVDAADTSLRVGLGNDAVRLSGSDASYRLWVGNANPALAPFSVTKAGYLRTSSGTIGGWVVQPDRLEAGKVKLMAGGELWLGDGSTSMDRKDYVVLSAIDPNGWRLWAGNNDPASAPFRVNRWGQAYLGDARVSGVLQSTNFTSGVQGFSIDASGYAEFNNITARGRIDAVVCSERTISAVSGMLIVAEAAVLAADMAADDETIILDSDTFSKDDILRIKPDRSRDEYMKVVSAPTYLAPGLVQYTVVRDMAEEGHFPFKVGETIVRQGSAVQSKAMHTVASGEEGAEYGSYQPGGSGTKTEGGWLVFEGSRGLGPYIAVARRLGPLYNQFDEVVRIGNLQGVALLQEGNISNTPLYGAFVGDAAQYWAYDQLHGLRIKTRSGATAIDSDGITTDQFILSLADQIPNFIEDRAAFYLYQPTLGAKPRVGVKLQTASVQTTINRLGDMTLEDFDPDNDGVIDSCYTALHTLWASIENKPTTFTPAAHTHVLADVTDYAAPDLTEVMSRSWMTF